MNEKEVAKEYRSISKSVDLTPHLEKINELGKSISHGQNIQLKRIAVGTSSYEGSLRSSAINLLKKKIGEVEDEIAEKNKLKANPQILQGKIDRARSIRNRKLKKKFNKTRRSPSQIERMSPIVEGSMESAESASPTWRVVRSPRKTKKSKSPSV